MKTKPFSPCAGVLVSLLPYTFSISYIWRHDFGIPLYRNITVVPDFVLNDHGVENHGHPIIEEPSARRLPSVDYIDLASRDLFPRKPYNVYPDYNVQAWCLRWHGSQQPCLGPRGVHVNSNPDDMLEAWVVDPIGKRLVSSCPEESKFIDGKALNPNPMFGSFAESELDSTHCLIGVVDLASTDLTLFEIGPYSKLPGVRMLIGDMSIGANCKPSVGKQTNLALVVVLGKIWFLHSLRLKSLCL